MPIYIPLTKEKLTDELKQKVSKKITDVHCNITGASSKNVTVTFMSGYPMKNRNKLTLLGDFKIGGTKTSEVIERLKSALTEGIASTLKLDKSKIKIDFLMVNPQWIFEGNTVELG